VSGIKSGKIKYDSNLIGLIALFESETGAKVKDCISNGRFIFIIEEAEMGKAIGRNGSNVKKMEKKLNKKIKLVEFNSDVLRFIRNILFPITALDIDLNNELVTIRAKDANTKAMLIGRERHNINALTNIVKRHFNVKEIRVV